MECSTFKDFEDIITQSSILINDWNWSSEMERDMQNHWKNLLNVKFVIGLPWQVSG